MKTLLVLPRSRSYVIQPNLGLGYIASAIRRAGHEVMILDCIKEKMKIDDFFSLVRAHSFDMVGFHMFSQDYTSVKQLSRLIKEINPKIYTIVGGPHPTGDPHGIIEDFPHIDFAFCGEGDLGMPRLLNLLSQGCGNNSEFSRIDGLYWKGGESKSAPCAQIEDLDSLPFPAWDLMRPDTYPEAPHGAFIKQFPVAPLIISRGCPFGCTFCAGANHRHRRRSIDNVMEEIELLGRQYGVKELLIEDENFTLDRKLVQEFCGSLLRMNKGYTWNCSSGVRLSCVDLEDLQLMEKAGCHSISVGIEFGSQRIHDLTEKKLTLEMVREKMKLFAKTNIRVTGFFLLGIPGETLAEMNETVKLALALPLHRIQINNFIPLPGSQIWKDLKKEGNLANIDYDHFFVHDVAYVSNGIRKRDIKQLQKKAYLKFYLRWRIIKNVLSDIRSFNHLRYLIKRFMDVLV
ncbi:MAG: cobalamin-dependent protein [Candidatus Omnitrophota bacterium]|nr:cobalamin-dependent protein [Candidatus Omnitrophota bacterium]